MRKPITNSAPIVAVLTALLVAGCTAVGPDYQTPAPAVAPIEVATHITLAEQEANWWQRFNDPLLNELVGLTLANNPSLAAAQANVTAAYAIFRDVDNNNQPNGTLNADYTAQDQIIPGSGDERRNLRSYRVGTLWQWQIDLFGKLKRASEAALADADAQYYQWQDLQINLVAQVAETYAQLKGIRERIDVAQRTIGTLQQTRGIINSRLEAGFASPLDLHRIDAQLYGVKARIPQLSATYARIQNTLIALVGGQDNMGVINLAAIDSGLPELDAPLAIGEPTQLLRRRADLRAAERRLAAASASIGVATADLYPELSLSGFLGFLAGNSSTLNSDSRAWSIAPSLSWSVLDLGSVNARIATANAREQAALASFKQAVLGAVSETQTALSQYAETQRQRHLLEAQTRASQSALDIAKLQYEAGTIDLLDILDTERTLLAAEDNLVQAKTQTLVFIIDVYRAMGGGLVLAPLSSARNNSAQHHPQPLLM